MRLNYLAKYWNTKVVCFHSNVVITAYPEFNQSLFLIFQFCWFPTRIHAAVDSLNLVPGTCNQLTQLWSIGKIAQEKMKLRVLHSSCWTVLRAPCAGSCMSCVAERQIILSLTTCLITANICWDSKVSKQYCPLTFHFTKKQPHFLTQRPTSWRTW